MTAVIATVKLGARSVEVSSPPRPSASAAKNEASVAQKRAPKMFIRRRQTLPRYLRAAIGAKGRSRTDVEDTDRIPGSRSLESNGAFISAASHVRLLRFETDTTMVGPSEPDCCCCCCKLAVGSDRTASPTRCH